MFCLIFVSTKANKMKNPLKIFKTERGACNYADKLNRQNTEDIGINRYDVYFWGDDWAVIDEEQ